MKHIHITKVLELQNKLEIYYKDIKLNNLFKKYPKKISGLTFGYICPGAMKTVDYLNKNYNKMTKPHKEIVSTIKLLTDFQFFIEIIVIYKNYISENIYREVTKILKNNSCAISKTITEEITQLLGKLPQKIKNDIPDNFYHIRHNTLICSKNKELANERIELLKSIYGDVEPSPKDNYSNCLGKRDGITGCKDCCNHYFQNNSNECLGKCMDF
jgi:hypothetical protein